MANDPVVIVSAVRTAIGSFNGSLKDFFSSRYRNCADKCRHTLNRGIVLGLSGLVTLVFNAVAGFKAVHSIPMIVARVVLEPASWFMLWASFDILFYNWQDLKKEREFFKELSEMNIHFKAS